MGGAADQPQRSSSPLKRRASSMDLEQDADHKDDVDMLVAPGLEAAEESSQGTVQGDTSPPTDLSEIKTETELPLRNDAPPLDQQVKTIEALVKAFNETAVIEGDTIFLVSRQWLGRAQGFGADAKRASKESTQPQLGPVDNSDLIHSIIVDSSGQQFVRLKPGLGAGDFEAFPQEAWDLLMTWYGLQSGQFPIIRKAYNTAPDAVSMPNIQFEYYPPVFTIHRLWSATSPIPIEQELKLKKPPPITLARSTSCSYHSFLKEVKRRAGVQEDRKVRVWKLLQTLPAEELAELEGPAAQSSGIKTPPDSPRQSPELMGSTGAWPEILVDVVTFTKLEKDVGRAIVDAEDTTVNPKYNGKKSLALVGLAVDEVLVIDESVDKDNFVSTYSAASSRSDKTLATRGSSSSLAAQTRANTSGRSSPALAGPLTRGRAQQKSGRTIGCCGLQNLGNTCYMNSALQCVRSVEELTKYFLTHEAKKEINPDNPLSHNGDVANAYGKLLEEIYKDPPPNSVQPRHFKSIIGRYAPAFSGYGQQDSQEFVGFLLDGLQEDLNRIKKKPYIEKPDSTDEMIHNPAAIREMAAKVWDITKKRDDSVIADLFTGMYKSTLVCPVCDKVSITFDPFNNLTLPLPLATMWSRTVKYVPLNDAPVEIDVDLDKNSSIRTLKQYVSARVGVPVERLVAAEEFRDKFFKFYDDMSSISEEIQSSDIAGIHEVEASPTNNMTVVKKTKKYRSLLDDNDEEPAPPWEDPMAERLLVPVVHRINPDDPDRKLRSKKQGTWGELPPPHFIVVTPEEARSEDIIRRKVLEKVASYTTWSGFDEAETDPEMLNNTSDVDSGNAEVVAKSVEGEEDIVDVTMSGAPNGIAVPSSNSVATEKYPPLLKQFNQRRPKWIDPQEFLAPHFQNLFDLKYWRENNVPMPTGWQSIQDDTTLPTLTSRQPRPTSSDTEMRSPTPWDGSEESGSEGASPIQPPSVQTRMVDESSEEDSDFPKVKNLPQRLNGHSQRGQAGGRGKGKKVKGGRVYGKKARKRFEKQQRAAQARQSAEPEAELVDFDYSPQPDNGPLIRLGEGIVVDWAEAAFDMLFEGTSPSDTRGTKRWSSKLPVLDDPQLEANRKRRSMRRKNGISLDDCLDEFEKEEILSEQDTWYCPRCKEHRRASKKFDLWKTPDILVVHLKRFSSSGWRRDKLDVLVDFPVEDLDLTQRVIDKEDGKEEIYDLIAVDNHWGGLGGGHYTAFAKNFIDGEWYEYNDSSVSKQKDPSKVISSGAYLLFYRRRSEIPLGGPRFQEIFDRYNTQHSLDDDSTLDSGEGRRLGQGSSLRGSPSALIGADLTRPRGSLGLASGRGGRDGSDAELPTYQASLGQVGDGGEVHWAQSLRNSIEADGEDEAIDLPDFDNAGPSMQNITSAMGANWTFAGLKSESGPALDDDIASDVAQGDNSSVNDDPFASDGDMEPILAGSEFVESGGAHDDFSAFNDPPAPVEWNQKVHTVPASIGDDQDSEQVAEIHVGDDNEQSLSQQQQQRESPDA